MSLASDLVLRIAIAAIAGALLGLERELRGHDPGVRTHALVALGAALFTVAGAYGFADLGIAHDPARVAAQVAAGVGFIGAGAVLRSGGEVKGITTASTLWVSAALGVAAGAGAYSPLAAAVGCALVVLVVLHLAKPVLGRLSRESHAVHIEYERGYGTLGPLVRGLHSSNTHISDVELDDDDDAAGPGLRRATIALRPGHAKRVQPLIEALRQRPEVVDVRIAPLGRRSADASSFRQPVHAGEEVELQYVYLGDDTAVVPVRLAGALLSRSRSVEIVDVYFDTDELLLRRARCSLRVRQETGRRPQLIWKGPSEQAGGAKRRDEREAPIDRVPRSGHDVRMLLHHVELWDTASRSVPGLDGQELRPLGELRNERSVHDYVEGSRRLELVWDRLTYPTGAPETRVEVEAKTHSAVTLLEQVDVELRAHFGQDLVRPRRGKAKELCVRVTSSSSPAA
jgi:putative Mg2+ transporter-C (MgtC) family protein